MRALSSRTPGRCVIRSCGAESTGSTFGPWWTNVSSLASRRAQQHSPDTSSSGSKLSRRATAQSTILSCQLSPMTAEMRLWSVRLHRSASIRSQPSGAHCSRARRGSQPGLTKRGSTGFDIMMMDAGARGESGSRFDTGTGPLLGSGRNRRPHVDGVERPAADARG